MAAHLCTHDVQGQRRVGGGTRAGQGHRPPRQQVPWRLRPERPLDVVAPRTDNDAHVRVRAGDWPAHQSHDMMNTFETMKYTVLIPTASAE